MPEPQITRSDQIKVRVLATSICGTDYHIYSWDRWSAGRVKPPRIMGHEFAGEIVEVGRGCDASAGRRLRQRRKPLGLRALQTVPAQRAACLRQHANSGRGCGRLFRALCGRAAGQRLEKRPRHSALSGLHSGPARQRRACHAGGRSHRAHRRRAGLRPDWHFRGGGGEERRARPTVYATDTRRYRLDLAKQLGADRPSERDPRRFGKLYRGAHGRAGRRCRAGNVGRAVRDPAGDADLRGAAGASR